MNRCSSTTHDKGFRSRFAALADAHAADVQAVFEKAGVDALELSTEDDITDALLRFADMRKHRVAAPPVIA